MARIRLLSIAGAATVVLAAGCGSAPSAGKFPIVVRHPQVQSTGVPNVKSGSALLRPPRQVVFSTTGTTSCVWWPARLTVLDASTIRIDMRVNGRVAGCGSGGAVFPIAVNLPRIIDLRHSLTVRLAFKVRLPHGGGINKFENTLVAPGISG